MMLLRLLGLAALSAVCSTLYRYPLDDNGNVGVADNTKVYNGPGPNGSFSDKPSSSNTGAGLGLGRSLFPTNMSDPTGNALPGDMSVMFPDTSICDVLLTSPETVTIDQIPFFCLCSHCKATMGPKGDHGDRGPPGVPGSPGMRGLPGFRGPPGFTGLPGEKGQKGDLGDKGQQGEIGLTGMKGEWGFKGEKGDIGVEGPAGPVGPQGQAGSCPEYCQIFLGSPGVQGPSGQDGARGLPGTTGTQGPPGSKGDKGDVGLPGKSGLDGLKGEQGKQGTCNCTNGVDGTNGQKGDKGDMGNKGETGSQGVQGPVGLTGEKGDMGMLGLPGPCSPAIQSAFSACLTKPFPINDQPVPFTKILYNLQDHFNSIIGVYIAPVNGTYVFTFSLAVKDKVLVAGLFHNFYPVFKMTESTNLVTSSQRVVLHLKSRDMVWIQVKDLNTNGMYTDTEITSTFSGFLLHPDSCDLPDFRDFQHIPNLDKAKFSWNGPPDHP